MSSNGAFGPRAKLGALLLDGPRYLTGLGRRGGWVNACNRGDVLEPTEGRPGVAFECEASSDLHACHVFPRLGAMLMGQAVREWPFEFAAGLDTTSPPDLSFVVPFRGRPRVPVLRATLQSICAQRGISVECIVVEQNAAKEADGLPEGVRHIHLPHGTDPTPWRKCW